MNISKNSGNLLIAIGVLHNLIGFTMGWGVLSEIARSGFVNSINQEMDRNAIFWFLFCGFMLMIIGKMIQEKLQEDGRVPRWLGMSLLSLAGVGVVMMPLSGIWLVLPPAIMLLMPDKKRTQFLM